MQQYAPGQGGPTTQAVDQYLRQSSPSRLSLIDMLNRGQVPRGTQLPPFAVNRDRMLAEEARQEELYAHAARQPAVEMPTRMRQDPGTLTEMLMGQYDPARAPGISSMLVAKSKASPLGRMNFADNISRDVAMAAKLHRAQNGPIPAEHGSPGLKGALFEAWMNLLGQHRAL